MRIVECTQGTPEWLLARSGKATGSRMNDVTAKLKNGNEAKTRADYRVQIVAETLTGRPAEDGYINAAMQWGVDNEPFARASYEVQTGAMVDVVGFCLHPRLDRAGASPDGLVGKDGMVEIKCPKTTTHLQYLLDDVVPTEYQPQMLWEMACAERQWCDFVSFDPRLPEHLQLFIKRFDRDDTRIADLTAEVVKFLNEVDALLAKLPQPEVVHV